MREELIIYYPLFLQIENKPCLLVGGGNTAYQKCKKLLEYGADLKVVSPDIDDRLYNLLPGGKIILENYHKKHCQGKLIIIAATDDEQLNKKIAEDAVEAGALFNSVDQLELCQFIVPAIVNRGDLQIAISTTGKSPALAGLIRKELEDRFGGEYEYYLRELGVLRDLIKKEISDKRLRKEILIKMAELVYKGGRKGVTPTQEVEKK